MHKWGLDNTCRATPPKQAPEQHCLDNAVRSPWPKEAPTPRGLDYTCRATLALGVLADPLEA